MKLFVSEVFEKISHMSSDEEKANFLKLQVSVPLQHFLYQNFSDKIQFLLPETPAPFKPNSCPIGLADANLYREFKKMYLFYKGGHATLHQARREQLWIQLLEGLANEEAVFLETLKNKKLEQRYGITRRAVELAYPNLLEKLPPQTVVPAEVPVPVVLESSITVGDKPEAAEKSVEAVEKPVKKTRTRRKKNESQTGTIV